MKKILLAIFLVSICGMCFSQDAVGKYQFKIPEGVKLKVSGSDKDGWWYNFEWEHTYLTVFECIPAKGAPGLKENEISEYIDDMKKDLKANKLFKEYTFKKEKVKLGLFSGYSLLTNYRNTLGDNKRINGMLWDGKSIWSVSLWTNSKDDMKKVDENVKKAKGIIKSATLNK